MQLGLSSAGGPKCIGRMDCRAHTGGPEAWPVGETGAELELCLGPTVFLRQQEAQMAL